MVQEETGMPLVLLLEWDNPKDEERNEKRLKFANEVWTPYSQKLMKEKDVKVESSVWSDNTGHMVQWIKFETMEDFAKMWNDERQQQMIARWAYLVDNVRIRLLRPLLTIPEDLK